MPAEKREERPAVSAWRPVRERDPAARSACAQQLASGTRVIGGKHRADTGHDDVEGRVRKWEVFGVCLDPVDGAALRARAVGADIEYLRTGRELGKGDEVLGHGHDDLGEARIRRARPYGPLGVLGPLRRVHC